MTRIYVDAGTSWTKVLEAYEDEKDLQTSPLSKIVNLKNYIYKSGVGCRGEAPTQNLLPLPGEGVGGGTQRAFLFPSKFFAQIDIKFDGATGHMVKDRVKPDGLYQNEVLSLAYGAQKTISDLEDATIVDIGSRDIKWVKFEDNKYRDLDWNGSCGSVTGATVEMLCKFYNVNPSNLTSQKERIPVTCGVFAMEKIMDDIASDVSPDIAIARYIHGIAYNTWVFAKKPAQIYLSGGFCMNQCFIDTLKFYCDVISLGRFMLIEGLY